LIGRDHETKMNKSTHVLGNITVFIHTDFKYVYINCYFLLCYGHDSGIWKNGEKKKEFNRKEIRLMTLNIDNAEHISALTHFITTGNVSSNKRW